MNKTKEQKEKARECTCNGTRKENEGRASTEFGSIGSNKSKSRQYKTNNEFGKIDSTTESNQSTEHYLKGEKQNERTWHNEFANDYYASIPTIDHYSQERSEQYAKNNSSKLNKNLNNRSNQNASR